MIPLFGEIPYPEVFWPVSAFLFGLLIGSFLNVCIYRLPRDESVVTPRSRCPHCGRPIAWYENIPVVSYVVLRGRCSTCGRAISSQYLLVELANGLLYAGLAVLLGPTALLLKYAVLGSILLTLAIIDFHHRILPDEFTLGGLILGLTISPLVPVGDGTARVAARFLNVEWSWRVLSAGDSVLGAVMGFGILYATREGYFWWRRHRYPEVQPREGMGFGDLKLMAAVGAFLGPQSAALTIFIGSMMGTVLSVPLWLYFMSRRLAHEARSRRPRSLSQKLYRVVVGSFRFTMSAFRLQFGVLLVLAALVAALWGKELVSWYLGLL